MCIITREDRRSDASVLFWFLATGLFWPKNVFLVGLLIDMCGQERGVAKDIKYIFRGWHKQGFALANLHTVDIGLAPKTDDDDKRIAVEVDLLCHLYHHTVHHEIRTVDELGRGLCAVVGGAIFGPDLIVDSILGLLGVQFTRLAMRILASEVIDAIGDVAGLLNLCQEATGTDGMQTTGREEEQVALMCLVGGNDVGHRVLSLFGLGSYHLFVVVGRNALLEAGVNPGAYVALDDIPHLGLTRTTVALHGQLIVGMNLYAEVLARVDELDEQRELIAEALIDFITYKQPLVLVDELGEGQSYIHIINQSTLDGNALVARYARDFPTLANIWLSGIDAFEWSYLVTAP